MTDYNYVSLKLRVVNHAAVSTVQGELAQWLADHRPANGELVGLFVPELGWSELQVVLLLGSEDAAAHSAFVDSLAPCFPKFTRHGPTQPQEHVA
jgi:hypothetical protein